jgi:chaperonin GroEL
LTVTKDGVTVASSINLYDPEEDQAVKMVRQAAQRTAVVAGDGTTTSIVLAEAIINETDKVMKDSDLSITEVTRHIENLTKDVVKRLTKRSKKLTGGRLVDVASISANNDRKLGRLIADGYKHVGKSGLVSVAHSKTSETHLEKIDGVRIDRGYSSKNYITDHKRGESVLESPLVLVTDMEIPSVKNILPIIEYCINKGRPLFIIGEMNIAASAAIEYNVVNGKIKACSIVPPSFGYRREEMMKDICDITGATFISEKLGNDWNAITPSMMGSIDKVITSSSMTVLVNETKNEATLKLIDKLDEEIKSEDVQSAKEVLMERLSCISGKAAIIHVGGESDIEIKEKKDRVDDSVFATRAAVEEGILPGGGVALLRESENIKINNDDPNELAAANILQEAMAQPFRQIIINAGLDDYEIGTNVSSNDDLYQYGFNVKDRKYGDMYKMGVIDPSKVTKSSLTNAVSVATTILMCDTVITNMRDNESVK